MLRQGREGQAGHCRQRREGIIAQRRDGFQRHVAGSLNGPLVVLFEQDRANEARNGRFIFREDARDLGAAV